MGRMRNRHIGMAALAAVLAFGTCSNPVDLVEEATEEVLQANDRYLTVVAYSPANGAAQVSPSAQIVLEFDRSLEETTVTEENIVVTPSASWIYSYNDTTRTLSLRPALEGQTTYTVVLNKGLTGVDGKSLYRQKAWSFTTAPGPSGSVVINANAIFTESYTGNTLTVSASAITEKYRYGTSISAFTNPDGGWTDITTRPFTVSDVNLGSSQGLKTVYIQFMDDEGNTTSAVSPISDTIFYDTTPPLAPAVTSTEAITLDPTPTWTWTHTSGGGGGSYRYQVNSTSGSWTATDDTAYTAPSLPDGAYRLYVQEKDATWDYYSASGSYQVRVTCLIPYHKQKSVSRTPILRWRSAGKAYQYQVQVNNGKVWGNYGDPTTGTSYTVTIPLPSEKEITWRVEATPIQGLKTYIPSAAGYYFTTGD